MPSSVIQAQLMVVIFACAWNLAFECRKINKKATENYGISEMPRTFARFSRTLKCSQPH
jgi:hypothetical protein